MEAVRQVEGVAGLMIGALATFTVIRIYTKLRIVRKAAPDDGKSYDSIRNLSF